MFKVEMLYEIISEWRISVFDGGTLHDGL